MSDGLPLEIRIWADVTCPWCWIGHRRLLRALERSPGLEARLVWQPYQLQPELPPEGTSWAEMLEERFDGPERAHFLLEHVSELGRREDIEFHFDRMKRVPNTLRAHALVLAARQFDVEWPMATRLFRAHFTGEADLSDRAVLHSLADEVGLPRTSAAAAIDGSEFIGQIEASHESALADGVQGVPYFLIGGRISLTGAQPPEVFTRALDSLRKAPEEPGTGLLDGES